MALINPKKRYTYKYPHPALTTDSVVFGFDGKALHVLLIERGIEPYKGCWALPGGFMRMDETVEECARRELHEETNVDNVYLEQFHVFSAVNRDPRERVVTVAFLALVRMSDYRLLAGDDAANAYWFKIEELPPLAFDHHEIILKAREYLQEVLRTRPIAFKLLDEKFSMSELQRIYEAINDTTYDRRNFAKKMTSSGFLVKENRESEAEKEVQLSMDYNMDEEAMGCLIDSCNYSSPAPRSKRRANLFSFDEDAFDEEKQKDPNGRNPFQV